MAVGHLKPKFGIQRVALGLAAVAIAALVMGVAKSAALGPAGSYTSIAFADGFESGDLSHWNGLLGNGSATATAAAAHTGSYGLRLSNASGQFQVLAKGLDHTLKKVGEEATETIVAAKNSDPESLIKETADLLYHLVVLLVERGVTLEAIGDELSARRNK